MTQSTALAAQQGQTAIQTKVKQGADGDGQDITVLSVSQALERPGLERIETVVVIPPDYQYAIPKWIHQNEVTENDVIVKRGSGSFVAVGDKVGLTIDGYDYVNRVVGTSFFLPNFVHDEMDEARKNPIHRKDYIYLRLAAVWYTPLGQLVYASEDVEVDFRLAYMESRATAKSAKPLLVNGQVDWDASGNPMLELSPDDEMKALKDFANKRNFGPRYAQSVARVRLLKMSTGIRSLPIKLPTPYPIKFVTWRDQLTAQARIAQVTGDTANLYGRTDETKPLSAAEMAEAGETGAVEETDLDAEAVARAQEARHEATAVEATSDAPTPVATPQPPAREAQEPVRQEPVQGTLMDDPDDPSLPPMR